MTSALTYTNKHADSGVRSYADMVRVLKSEREETISDAGRYWQDCPFTRDILRQIDDEIAGVEKQAETAWYAYAASMTKYDNS